MEEIVLYVGHNFVMELSTVATDLTKKDISVVSLSLPSIPLLLIWISFP